MIVLIVATYSYTQLAGLNALGQDALLSRHVSPRRLGEPGAYAQRYVLEPLLIVRKVSSIGMDRVMRSINAMGVAVSKVRLLYVLQPSTRIRKRFRFYEGAERITRAVSPKLFRRNFSQAIRTA